MNNQNAFIGKTYKSSLIRKLVAQYALTLLSFVLLMVLLIYAAYSYCSHRVWYDTDPLWHMLHWVQENLRFVSMIACLLGWLAITLVFMLRLYYHLKEVVEASEQLVNQPERPVVLSPFMKSVQDELNMVREQTLRNSYLAKEAEQRKNDLIVYLAHDLKTPLTSILGYLTLLQDEPQLSAEMRSRYTGIALNKAERLESLINEFFEITRFNLTVMTLEMETVNLSRMLEQIAYEFIPIFSEKGLTCHSVIEPNVELVCDSDKLERVLDNLIRNAVNYSYRDTMVQLSMRCVGGAVEIQVMNRGKTIPKEKLSHVFEQFFRLDTARSSVTGGAGLGLAISKEIVEKHGGNISVISENENTIFTVRLPHHLE